ncbi:MAG TPA: LuxR C-terminal-related transcriptional regulator [Caulobacteraceae bacterium]|nr:LuxR C-terminal-related transcriptional regulator [Caulobacteraceae bacterium]
MNASAETGTVSLPWVIKTKLGPPQAAFSVISRPALLGEDEPRARLTLICAPAGFGKTTLMSELWDRLRSQGVVTPWLSLDEMDASGKDVLSYIVVSCLQAGSSLAPLAQMAETGFSGASPEVLSAMLINGLIEDGRPTVLFLDDFHLVKADAALRFLIAKAPPCLKFVIGSRQAPDLGLAGLRARGQLRELALEQLRFTAREIAAFFEAHGLSPDISEMKDKTEGWAVALQLAVPWLQQNPEPGALARFSGRSEDIAGYLLEEVLRDLPDEEQDFLALTSLLERVNGDLANAVTGRADGWELLERQHRRGLPMAPLDDERNWFRYHHLLAEFLSEKLARLHFDKVEEVHRRAAEWFAAHDHLQEAVAHGRKVADPDFATDLIERHGGWRLFLSLGVSGLRAFGNLPEVSPLRYPLTVLGKALLQAVDGQVGEARRSFSDIRQRLEAAGRLAEVTADISNVDFALQSYEDRVFDREQVMAAEAAAQGPQVPPSMRVLAENFVVIAMTSLGDDAGALARSNGVLQRNRELNATYAELYVALYRGLAQLRLGETAEARELFAYVAACARERFGPSSNHAANGDIFVAYLDYMLGDYASARTLLGEKMQTIEYAEGTCDILLHAFEVGLGLARQQNGFDAVRALIERADRVGRMRGWERLKGFAACWRVRELVFADAIAEARAEAQSIGLEDLVDPQSPAWRWSLAEQAALTSARLSLEENDPGSSLARVRALESDLRARQHQPLLADALLVKAAALHVTGAAAPASVAFQEALRIASTRGLRSLFRDQGGRCRAAIVAMASPVERQRFAIPGRPAKAAPGSPPCPGAAPEVTEREVDVLCAIADGLSNKEAAKKLAISESTVKFHRKNLYRKLNVTTRSRAISTGREWGLFEHPGF